MKELEKFRVAYVRVYYARVKGEHHNIDEAFMTEINLARNCLNSIKAIAHNDIIPITSRYLDYLKIYFNRLNINKCELDDDKVSTHSKSLP